MAFSGFSEDPVTLGLPASPQAPAIRPTYPSLRYSKRKKGKSKKKKGKKGGKNNQVINYETLLEQSIFSLYTINIALITALGNIVTPLQLPPYEVDILEWGEYHETNEHYDKD